jgi:hypothetical protein
MELLQVRHIPYNVTWDEGRKRLSQPLDYNQAYLYLETNSIVFN